MRWVVFCFGIVIAIVIIGRSSYQNNSSHRIIDAVIRQPSIPAGAWALKETSDPMSDQVNRVAYETVQAEGGYSFKLKAACQAAFNRGGQNVPDAMVNLAANLMGLQGPHLQITISAFNGGVPIGLKYNISTDEKTGKITKDLYLRYRLDSGQPSSVASIAVSEAELYLLFGRSLFIKDTFGGLTGLAMIFSEVPLDTALSLPIADLSLASSMKIEIPLVDGGQPVFDLQPRDPELQSVAQSCGFRMCRFVASRGGLGRLAFLRGKNTASADGWYIQNGVSVALGNATQDEAGVTRIPAEVADLFRAASTTDQPDDVQQHLAKVGSHGWMEPRDISDEETLCYAE